MYWANSSNTIPISFANLDGSGGGNLKTTGASAHGPCGVAIDPAHGRIYWANFSSNTSPISFANLDGSGGGNLKTTGASANDACGVAIDPAHGRIYWGNDGNNAIPISFANLDGSGGGDLKTTGATANGAAGVAIDPTAGRIYWTNLGSNTIPISFANLDGSGGGNLNTTGATAHTAEGLAIDPTAGRLYWANDGNNATPISFAHLNGSGGGDLPLAGATANGPTEPALLEIPSGAGAPAITGGSTPRSVLSCSRGSWAPDLLGSFLYRAPQTFTYGWTLNGRSITGASSSTLVTHSAGKYACRVTAANHAGASTQGSASHGLLPTIKKLKATIKQATHTAKFNFKASAGTTRFQCALIRRKRHHKKPHFVQCKSPKIYKNLNPGKYIFEVRALSTAGPGTPATRKFKIG